MFRRSTIALLAALIGIPAVALVSATPGHAVGPGSNGKVVFESNRSGTSEIYSVNSDGTGLEQLTSDPVGDMLPRWSPDGTKIAFIRGVNPAALYIMNADGSSLHLAASPANLAPAGLAWSGDGSELAYVTGGSPRQVGTINVDGSGASVVVSIPNATPAFPAWSPDGSRIAYEVIGGPGSGIYLVNPDGSNQVQLSNDANGVDQGPSFSPDGTRIVFVRAANAADEIWSMNTDGSGQTQLTSSGQASLFPRFSPDGNKVLFQTAATENGPFDIDIMNSDGSNVQGLIVNPADDEAPDWQSLASAPPPPTTTTTVAPTTTTTVAPTTTTTVAPTTTTTVVPSSPHSQGGFVLDDWGGIHPFRAGAAAPPAITVPGPYWSGQDVARGIASVATAGFVVDDWGGIHPYVGGVGVTVPLVHDGPYWPGQDVVRGIALMPGGSGGYVLDDWGGLHPFGVGASPAPPQPQGGPYWTGIDAARGVTILPDGSGGYVVDDWGGLHAFVIPGSSHHLPAQPTNGPYWVGQNVVRGVAADAEGNGGYVVDDWGGIHPFSIPGTTGAVPVPSAGPYWVGLDVVRGISVVPAQPGPVQRPVDYVPAYSVLAAYPQPAFVGPLAPDDPNLRPWDHALVAHGATAGYARTWVGTSGPGGYTVYAFEFPDSTSAQAAASDAFGSFVTTYGAAPFTISPAVSSALIVGDCARAYWTQGNFLRIVDLTTQFTPDNVANKAQADTRSIVSALLAA